MTKEKILQVIFDALKMTNHAREEQKKIPITDTTILYGQDGHLDSMNLVAFLIDIEESLQDQGLKISLSDERAMSQTNSPFHDVQTLVDYIFQLTEAKQ